MQIRAIGETIAHELGLHGHNYKKYIDAILKGKSLKDLEKSESEEHEALMNSNLNSAAYRFYKSIMDQLIRIDKEYEIRMKNDQKRNHE